MIMIKVMIKIMIVMRKMSMKFLDALASLRPMMEIKWVIGVFEIASIRALPCSRLLH